MVVSVGVGGGLVSDGGGVVVSVGVGVGLGDRRMVVPGPEPESSELGGTPGDIAPSASEFVGARLGVGTVWEARAPASDEGAGRLPAAEAPEPTKASVSS